MLQAIGLWIDAHLVFRPDSSSNPYHWRDFDRILSDGFYFACADHAFFVGEVAHAKGIPVVFVKTLDADFDRTLDDGTHVVVIYAADEASLLRQLDQLVVP